MAEAELSYENAYRIATAVELSDRSGRENWKREVQQRHQMLTGSRQTSHVVKIILNLNSLLATGAAANTALLNASSRTQSVSTVEKRVILPVSAAASKENLKQESARQERNNTLTT